MNDWISCDGQGGEPNYSPRPASGHPTLATRRSVLVSLGALLAAWSGRGTALGQATITPGRSGGNVLVVIFMRGGADGLNMVVPYAEPAYYRARPTLAIAAPNQAGVSAKSRAVDLDGFYGLHPALSPLVDLYRQGQITIVHACGSNDETRSHFEAMSTVERGAPRDHAGPASGWLARHLASSGRDSSPLRAVAIGDTVPDSLRGATSAIALTNLSDFSLSGGPSLEAGLREMYGGTDAVAHAGQQTLAVLKTLRNLDVKSYRPSNGSAYPTTDLGNGLQQVACLIRANAGLEIACLDKGGWDTHVAQGADTGWQAFLMQDLSASIAAFCRDLGPELNRVTVVVMSEFGRRVAENAGLGTDHGRATPMYVIGGGLVKARVAGHWPGLNPGQLDEVGDLKVTTDYRSVLGEALRKRMGNSNLADVFPGWTGEDAGIFF
jgi:uncharacterized protein (DUF1501 family)